MSELFHTDSVWCACRECEGYELERDRADDDEWVCEFGERCLVPHFIHRRSECHTVEMAQAWRNEDAQKYFNLCPRCAAKWR